MANSETDFCTEFREALEAQLGPVHAIKHSDAFIVGIADLQLQIRQFGHWLVEAKFLRASLASKNEFKLNMTDKQRKFLKREINAGGQGGWFLCVRFSDRLSHLYVGANLDLETVPRDHPHVVRGHGEKWNTHLAMSMLKRDFAKYHDFAQPSSV